MTAVASCAAALRPNKRKHAPRFGKPPPAFISQQGKNSISGRGRDTVVWQSWLRKSTTRFRETDKAAYPGSRLAGLSAIHARLAEREDKSVGLKIFKNCVNLIREFPALPTARATRKRPTQTVLTTASTLRYGLLYRPIQGRRVRLGGV
jgi:hypothetical protein